MNKDESEIRSLIENWARAVRNRDMAGILRHHTRDIVMFDVPPPLQSIGIEEYEQTWPLFYGASPNPPVFDIRDISITAGTDVAFVVALMHCVVVEKDGRKDDLDFRLTVGLRKLDGQWTITHEHHSIPAT
jgi:uncharacterized protein (TIGR02246 family)